MSQPNVVSKHHHHAAEGLERIGSLFAEAHPELAVSKRRMRKVESIACVRMNRENARQNLGFSSRPFVLCGLPVKRPAPDCLLTNGAMVSSCFRSRGTRATVCRGDRIGSSPFFLPRWPSVSSRRGLRSEAPPRCWIPSGCGRAVRNIAG